MCDGFIPVPVVPSPKSQEYEAIASSSEDPEASNSTSKGALPVIGFAIAAAVGAKLVTAVGETTISIVSVSDNPSASVTVRIAS